MNIQAEPSIIWPHSLSLSHRRNIHSVSHSVPLHSFLPSMSSMWLHLFCVAAFLNLLTVSPLFHHQQKSEGHSAAVPSVLQPGLQPHLCQPGLYEASPRCSEVSPHAAPYFHSLLFELLCNKGRIEAYGCPQIALLVCHHSHSLLPVSTGLS